MFPLFSVLFHVFHFTPCSHSLSVLNVPFRLFFPVDPEFTLSIWFYPPPQIHPIFNLITWSPTQSRVQFHYWHIFHIHPVFNFITRFLFHIHIRVQFYYLIPFLHSSRVLFHYWIHFPVYHFVPFPIHPVFNFIFWSQSSILFLNPSLISSLDPIHVMLNFWILSPIPIYPVVHVITWHTHTHPPPTYFYLFCFPIYQIFPFHPLFHWTCDPIYFIFSFIACSHLSCIPIYSVLQIIMWIIHHQFSFILVFPY